MQLKNAFEISKKIAAIVLIIGLILPSPAYSIDKLGATKATGMLAGLGADLWNVDHRSAELLPRSELRSGAVRYGFAQPEIKSTHSFASFNVGRLLKEPLEILPDRVVNAVRAYLQKAYDKKWLKGFKVVDLTASHIQIHVTHNFGENNADVHRIMLEAVRAGLEKMKDKLTVDPTAHNSLDTLNLISEAQVTFADHPFKERPGVSESVEVAMGVNVDISAFNNTAYELFANLDLNPAMTLSGDKIRGVRFYIQKREDILRGRRGIKVLEISQGENGEPDVNQMREIKILAAQTENVVTAVYPVPGRTFKDPTEPLMTVTFQPAFGSSGEAVLNPIAIFRGQSGGPAVGAVGHTVANTRLVLGGPNSEHYVAVRPFTLKEARRPIKEEGIGGFVMYGYEQAGNGYMPRDGYISDYFGLSRTFLHGYIQKAKRFAEVMLVHKGFQPYLHPLAAAKKAEPVRRALNDRFVDVVKDFDPDPFYTEVIQRVENGELILIISGKGDYGANNGHTKAAALFTALQRAYLEWMKEKGLIDDYFTLGQDPTRKMERLRLERNYAAGDDTHMSIVIKARTNNKGEIDEKIRNAQTIIKRAMALGATFHTLAFKDTDQKDKPGVGTYGPFQDLVGTDLEDIKEDPFGWLGFAEEGTERFFELANQLADQRDIKAGVIRSLHDQWQAWKKAGGQGDFTVDRGRTGNTSAQGIGIASLAFDPKLEGGFAELDADKMGPPAFNILFFHAMQAALPEHRNGLVAEVWDLKAFDENDNIAAEDLPTQWSDISHLVHSAMKAKEKRITDENAKWLKETAYQNGTVLAASTEHERLGAILKEIGFVPSKRIFLDVETELETIQTLLGDSDRFNVKAVWDKKKAGWDPKNVQEFLNLPIAASTVSRLGLLSGGEYVGKDDPKKMGRIRFMQHVFDYLAKNPWMLQGNMNGSHQLQGLTLPVNEAIATLNSAPIAVALIYRFSEDGNLQSVEDVFKAERFRKRAKAAADFNLDFISAQRATNPHLAHREQVEGAYAIEAISRHLDSAESPFWLDKLRAQKPGQYPEPVSADASTLYNAVVRDEADAYQELSGRAELRDQVRLARIDFDHLPPESVARLTRFPEKDEPQIFSNVFFHDGLWKDSDAMHDSFERLGALSVTTNQSIAQTKAATWKPYVFELLARGLSDAEIFLRAYHREARIPFEALALLRARYNGAIGQVSQEASAFITDKNALVGAMEGIDGLFGEKTSLVKLPNIQGTIAGLRNIAESAPQATYERVLDGRSGNITLGFSVDHFLAHAEQHIAGLEQRAKNLEAAGYSHDQISRDFAQINWVFSLFMSRIDRLVVPWFDEAIAQIKPIGHTYHHKHNLRLLKGKTSVALGRFVGQVMQAIYLGKPLNDDANFLPENQKRLVSDLRNRFRALGVYAPRPLNLLIASSGKYEDQPYASPLQYVLPFLGEAVWNTLPPKTLQALSDLVKNNGAARYVVSIDNLRTQNLIQNPIPMLEQPDKEDEHAYEDWDSEILSGSRKSHGVPTQSASSVLKETQDLLLSERKSPDQQTFTAIGNERRDAGAKAFAKAEQEMLDLIGKWRVEFETRESSSEAQRAELRLGKRAAAEEALEQAYEKAQEIPASVEIDIQNLPKVVTKVVSNIKTLGKLGGYKVVEPLLSSLSR
ncbi:MAG: fructose 1,6-bisphosphatase, partial [Candidatus Omnitrophica bacterium]|nr:fructose 1,6-bisphosphatase [Candidatus Omnitrophota bacterium]